nr:MBL fold metallo-hydrolase [Corynebacterium lactis]
MTTLTLRRWVHASIEVYSDTSRLFVDPGFFGVPEGLNTADAILITHDHFDHDDLLAVADAVHANPDLTVYSPVALSLSDEQTAQLGPDGAAELADRTVVVKQGDHFEVGDIGVDVVGEFQEIASLDDAPIPNVGYLIGGKILHPGDARQDTTGVDTLMVALAAPWQKNTALEEHLRRVRPRRVVGYHDITLSEMGRDFARKTLKKAAAGAGAEAIALDPGEELAL